MDVGELRHRLSLTQTQFAALLGVSQAAVSQYESGRHEPAGEVQAFYVRLQTAADAAVVVEHLGQRATTMPSQRWVRVLDPARITNVELPVRLDWSPRAAGHWNYHDEQHRRELYRLVIDVGEAIDVMTYLDVDELASWSNELLVSRDARRVLDALVERTNVRTGV